MNMGEGIPQEPKPLPGLRDPRLKPGVPRSKGKCALAPGGRHFVGFWTASRFSINDSKNE